MVKINNILYIPVYVCILLLFACCTKEEMPEYTENADISFCVSLPDDIATRAYGNGKSVNQLVVGVYKPSGNNYEEIKGQRYFFDIENGNIKDVTLSLAKGQAYSFVFWAYNSSSEIYNIDDLTSIVMDNHSDVAMTLEKAEKSDAFYAVEKRLTINGHLTHNITLTRPLAQINIGTSGSTAGTVCTVKGVANVFHPFSGTVSGEDEYIWKFNELLDETFTVEDDEYKYLAMGYVFAPVAQTAQVSCGLELGNIETMNIPVVKIQANRRSNIIVGEIADTK